MKLSVKSLLFDYGGTIDTNGIHWGEAMWNAYARYDCNITREQFRKAYIQVERQLGSNTLILPHHTFKETLQIKVSLQFEALRIEHPSLCNQIIEVCYDNTRHCIREACMVLDRLWERYPMYLVSNFYGNLPTVLREFHLTHYFQAVIESAEAGFRKPDPEIFRIALEKTGCLPEEVVVIGDSYKNDIQPANNLGCPSIWLKVKGWDDDPTGTATHCQTPLSHSKDCYIIDDFSKLAAILL